ncbi:hypothetical protein MHYP_G00185270 [Metynnis hypsauchen]
MPASCTLRWAGERRGWFRADAEVLLWNKTQGDSRASSSPLHPPRVCAIPPRALQMPPSQQGRSDFLLKSDLSDWTVHTRLGSCSSFSAVRKKLKETDRTEGADLVEARRGRGRGWRRLTGL